MMDKTVGEVRELIAEGTAINPEILRLLTDNPGKAPLFPAMPRGVQRLLNVRGNDPVALSDAIKRQNWAKLQYAHLQRRFPAIINQIGNKSLTIAIDNDARFNGDYYKLGSEFLITFPLGTQTFLRFIANIFGMTTNMEFREVMAEGFSQATQFPNWKIIQKVRKHRIEAFGSLAKSGHLSRFSYTAESMIRCYADLSTVANPGLEQKLKLPCLPILAFGHPLEVGFHLTAFATNFVLLHELGHVYHEHDPTKMAENPTCAFRCELEADEFAIDTIVDSPRNNIEKVANLVGASLFLLVAKRLENFRTAQSETHPAAQERIERLFARLEKSVALRELHTITRLLSKHLDNVGEFLRDASMNSAERMPHTLKCTLTECLENDRQDLFLDTVLRWMLVGSPRKVCHCVGALKYRLDQIKRPNPNEEKAVKYLSQIFEVTKNIFIIRNELDHAYASAAGRPSMFEWP